MPEKLLSCVRKVRRKGIKNPWGICISSTGLYPHRNKRRYKK